MIENKLLVQKTIRYYTIGSIEKADQLLIALHGYGQLPSYFGRKFENLSDNYLIVIPEGMHRFYLEGSYGRVGASWMTKEARQDDIQDNLNYIDQVVKQFTKEKSFQKIILLGFSQGGATAARYFYSSQFNLDHLILWACLFPPDLTISNETKKENENNYFILGKEDPYFTENHFSESITFYSDLGFKTIEYPGNHSIEPVLLSKLLNNL